MQDWSISVLIVEASFLHLLVVYLFIFSLLLIKHDGSEILVHSYALEVRYIIK